MKSVNLILVDDEQEACINLQNILLEYVDKNLNIVGIAHDTKSAEEKIKALQPDAIFLDIEMPNENAFQFLQRIQPVNFEIIFVTAYDEYAVQAFRLNAIDYILKPINIGDLSRAVDKLKERITFKSMYQNTGTSYQDLASQMQKKNKQYHITLKDKNDVEVVAFSDILYVVAMGSYAKIIFKKNGLEKSIIMSSSIAEYEYLFPSDLFYRIHKSYLINVSYVQTIVRDDQAFTLLTNNVKLSVSRRRLSGLIQFLKDYRLVNDGHA